MKAVTNSFAGASEGLWGANMENKDEQSNLLSACFA